MERQVVMERQVLAWIAHARGGHTAVSHSHAKQCLSAQRECRRRAT